MKMFRVILVLVFVLFWGGLGVAAEVDTALEKEISDVVKKYQQVFQEKNLDAIMEFFTEDAVLLGTGPGERYVGQEEIRNAYQHYFDSFDKEEGTVTWYQAGSQGSVVWVAGMSNINTYFKNKKTEFALNWTFVLEKKDGAWKIVQRHISNISCE